MVPFCRSAATCALMKYDLTRAGALCALEATRPLLGRRYADSRNTDHGADGRATTSRLSPYLRRRLLLEPEVVAAARADHGEAAEKFVQEVFWRTYFKGHLETRPWLWNDYLQGVDLARARLAGSSGLNTAYLAAVEGRTGIDGFDDWAHALVAHNWLHNHARMWFASIWVFTLKLPWALGAAHFLAHLIDGDPASNTLSWRWVAGLHTRGKAYAARADNIRRYTEGRYDPRGLNETPVALTEPDGSGARPLAPVDAVPAGEVALLVHLDDLHPESLPLGGARVTRVAGLLTHAPGAADKVIAADRAAMADALARAAARFVCTAELADEGWAGGLPIVTAWAPVGPSASAITAGVLRVRREWDSAVWPRSTKGFFQVRAAIADVLRAQGIAA